jgi:hypothetical protein
VEINIEQLILHGFSPGDRHGIAQALQQELRRLCAEQGVPASLATASSVHRLDAGGFRMASGAKAETVGKQVARSVYRGMST